MSKGKEEMRTLNQQDARQMLTSNVCSVVAATCVTPRLDQKLYAKAKEYGMSRSQFIRALLEMVDDEGLYEQLLGPTE
jgi:hypothetical protein